MQTSLCLIAAVLAFFATAPISLGAKPGTQAPGTQWDGVIAAINETSVTVKNPKGTKAFAIHPGTVFGQRAAKKLSDFKVGDNVLVVFSNTAGQLKAENIRNPDDDRKPGQKKGKAAAK